MADRNLNGRSVRLFLIDGTATGLVTAEVINWTGHALSAPMSRVQDLMKRPEAAKSGVYFLIGDDDSDPTRSRLYIGESDNVRHRLYEHQRSDSKDFVSRVCIVTSKDMNLTKGHVRYLEARLIEIAAEADRSILDNATRPPVPALPEADVADMEYFISQVAIVLPVLQFDVLRPKRPTERQAEEASVADETSGISLSLHRPKSGEVIARAIYKDTDFIVLKGSRARPDTPASTNHYRALRQGLTDSGTLVKDVASDDLVFERDTAFDSPSAAASVILDRNSNGRLEWRTRNDQTLKDYQNSLLPDPENDQ